jgi:hypothetical protein
MMGGKDSPSPGEWDVHLSVLLHGVRLDFAGCVSAALAFIQDAAQWCDAVSVIADDPRGLPRLPSERLYLDPYPERTRR